MKLIEELKTRYIHKGYALQLEHLCNDLVAKNETLDITGARFEPECAGRLAGFFDKLSIVSSEPETAAILENNREAFAERDLVEWEDVDVPTSLEKVPAFLSSIKTNNVRIKYSPNIKAQAISILVVLQNPNIMWNMCKISKPFMIGLKKFMPLNRIYTWLEYCSSNRNPSELVLYENQPHNLHEQQPLWNRDNLLPDFVSEGVDFSKPEWKPLLDYLQSLFYTQTKRELSIIDFLEFNEL